MRSHCRQSLPPAPSLLPLAQSTVPTQISKQAAPRPRTDALGSACRKPLCVPLVSCRKADAHTHNINGQAHRLTHVQEHACTLTQPQQAPSETNFLSTQEGCAERCNLPPCRHHREPLHTAAPPHRAQAEAHAGTALRWAPDVHATQTPL